MVLMDIIKRYKFSYKNYVKVIYKVRKQMITGNESKIKVILRDGTIKNMNLNEVLDYAAENYYKNYLKIMTTTDGVDTIKYKDKSIKFYGGDTNGDIMEVFFAEDYKFLNPDGSIVIDIGANIGDSAIYFALNGAEKVIALEPFPYSYNFALINIKENNLDDKIELSNVGYGKDEEIILDDKSSAIGSKLESAENGRNIPIYSLKTLINTYNLNGRSNLLLKMDCEGCEYNLLNEDNDTLKHFKRIQIEYHYGYKKLTDYLFKSGFYVTHSKPTQRNSHGSEPKMCMGYIYAKKL